MTNEQWTIQEFQDLMNDLYGTRDDLRGISKTLLWFFSEVGELAEAIRKEDPQAIELELADVFAWLVSLGNILGVNLSEAVKKKYPKVCPKCMKNPCECQMG